MAAFGVVVGPLSNTSHSLIAAMTESGTVLPAARRFSRVKPSIGFRTREPLASLSRRTAFSTFSASVMIIGPMPSPAAVPIITLSLFELGARSPVLLAASFSSLSARMR